MTYSPDPRWQGTTGAHDRARTGSLTVKTWAVGAVALLVMAVMTGAFSAVYLIGGFADRSGGEDYAAASDEGASDDNSSIRIDCEAGIMAACDELFQLSPSGSDDEYFGSTCGARQDPQYGACDDQDDSSSSDSLDDSDSDSGDPNNASLRAACSDGDLSACDDLWLNSPAGSDDETFGSDCGGRADGAAGSCSSADLDVARLDDLYQSCGSGDLSACDDLYSITPSGSDYELFGSTCGDTREPTQGSCDS